MNEKMIEEMAKDLKKCLPNDWYWQKSVDSDTYFVAKHFYNEGYRKIPKDAVVVDKELLKSQLQWLEKQARKETAKEILREVAKACGDYQWFKNLCEQFGVEVEE